MNYALKTAQRWGQRTSGIALRIVADRVDPFVEVITFLTHNLTVYLFSDGSTLVKSGRGVDFKIETFDIPAPTTEDL